MPSLHRIAALLLAVLFLSGGAAVARDEMQLLMSEPRPNQVMSGSGVAFALHFDHPVDHRASRFMLIAPDKSSRTLQVRLGAQPSVLYGSVGQLAAGDYTLNWSARAENGMVRSGSLPFQVRPPP